MKKINLFLLLCCVVCLCALPALAQEQSLPEIRINYETAAQLSRESGVPARVTVIEAGQERSFEAELRLYGMTADAAEAALPQPSLRVDGETMRFILHNDGGDAIKAKITGAVCCDLIARGPLATPVRAQEPVEVYLNGEYWGLYTKREMIEDTIARFEGLTGTAGLNIAQYPQKVLMGSVSGLRTLFDQIKTMDLSLEEDRRQLEGLLDTDHFLDWMAVNTFFSNGNLFGEVYFYQWGEEPWRCATGDFAYALQSASDRSIGRLIGDNGPQMRWGNVGLLTDKMLREPVYRDAFLAKIGALYQALPVATMQAAVDSANQQIAAALPAHMERWADAFAEVMGRDFVYPAANATEALAFQSYRVYRLRDKTMVRRPWYLYDSIRQALNVSDEEMLTYFGGPAPELPEVPDDTWLDYQTSEPK